MEGRQEEITEEQGAAAIRITNINDSAADIYVSYRRLKRKFDVVLLKLREVRDQGVRASVDPSQIPYFKGMVRSLEKYMADADLIWEELSELNEERGVDTLITKEDRELYSRALRYFHEASSAAESFPTMARVSVDANATRSTDQGHFPRKSHPVIPIPKFDGSVTKWRHFRDKFESLIIQDESLTDVDRFHYLSGALEGPAESVVENLPITGANFVIAWKTLNDTYDNPRLIASAYLDQFLDAKPLPAHPSASAIRLLVAQLTKAVAAFNTFNISKPLEFMFFHLAKRCLDKDTQEMFEWEHRKVLFPTFEQLMVFLKSRCEIQELSSGVKLNSTGRASSTNRSRPSYPRSKPSRPVHTLAITNPPVNTPEDVSHQKIAKEGDKQSSLRCFLCSEAHRLYSCDRFRALSVDQRLTALKDFNGCRNCLVSDHSTKKCSSRWRCRRCKGNHHSLLHIDSDVQVVAAVTHIDDLPDNSSMTVHQGSGLSSLLGTAIAQVQRTRGPPRFIRAILDSASHVSFIKRSIAEECGLIIRPSEIRVQGLSETPIPGLEGVVSCVISSPKHPGMRYTVKAFVVSHIMAPQPSRTLHRMTYEPFMGFDLADPEFWRSQPIDFLLGCDLFGDILSGEVLDVPHSPAKLLGTAFGQVVIGRIQDLAECPHDASSLVTQTPDVLNSTLQRELQRFWAVEEPPRAQLMSHEDRKCEAHFQDTVSRLSSGRYMVRLAFKQERPTFHGQRGIALRRLTHVESKLQRNKVHQELYRQFMQEYLDLGHMTKSTLPGAYFLPHHGVFKGTAPNEKVRVVFDASARSSQGSLNEHLLTGPKLQNDLPSILLNFRKHRFVFTVDISKMYRQILLHPSDRKYQHVLWRPEPTQEVQEFEMNTLTYGLSSAPFLALRVIRQLIADDGGQYPLAAAALERDMYVDDLVTGASTIEEACQLKHQVIALLGRGEFPLSKWQSNCIALLEGLEEPSLHDLKSLDLGVEDFVKILGLQWDPRTDSFSYGIDFPEPIMTKRGLLSSIARIFDPLGFVSPVIVKAKIILQQAWILKLDWDTPLPDTLRGDLQEFFENISALQEIRIPRYVGEGQCTHVLIYADASEKAYCAAAYLRTMHLQTASSSLLLSKTKLAPIKHLSIPRLELCAALLAANIFEFLQGFIAKLTTRPEILLFTDSQIVLGWIRRPHQQLPTFVANRVGRILELTPPESWFHVRSQDNPSDLGSRGLMPQDIVHNALWFNGPSWAQNDPRTWILDDNCVEPSRSDSQITCSTNVTVSSTEVDDWTCRFSSYTLIVRVTAWLLRFLHNAKDPTSRRHGALKASELRNAVEACCKFAQRQGFFKGHTISSRNLPKALISLSPYLDEQGILRVGGRLKHAPLPEHSRNPILLPTKSHLSSTIVAYYHHAFLHPGAALLTAIIRSKFWIVGLRSLARKTCRECVSCRRLDGRTCQPLMGDLPRLRFKEGRPFLHVGLDFAGPFIMRESLRRKAGTTKAYLCLAICMSTRAIHLEAVSSLSTPAFLASLDRFMGRRGMPSDIYTDNGTNFVGAANQLAEWFHWQSKDTVKDAIHAYAASKEIQWHYIPPHAPHFGGLWEAGVKSAKRLLRSVYKEALLTFEEFCTLLVKVEAMLNSRPLCPLSSDPNDGECLTPAHFLIGSSLMTTPEPSVLELKTNYNQRWQMVTRISQHFWKRWRQEYLQILQIKAKWHRPDNNLEVGDLVFLTDKRVPRQQWPRGRVVATHPGSDNIVRVATVRVAKTTYKRPVTDLVPIFAPSDIERP